MNTTPYWLESVKLPRFPQLQRELAVDVVVVGAGITGITAAWLLTEAGASVALVERHRCAGQDTGHTTAHLTCVTDIRLHKMIRSIGPAATEAVWTAGVAALDQIFGLVRRTGIDCGFHWVPGYLHDTPERKHERELQDEIEAATRLGIRAEYLPSVPFFQVPGVRFPNQALFHPLAYLGGILQRLAEKKCAVFEHTEVREIRDAPLCVQTNHGSISCKHLVLATHTPLTGNTRLLPALFFQTKLALYTTYALGARLPRHTVPEASFWDTDRPYAYLRIDRSGDHDYAIYGGGDHKTGQVTDTTDVYRELEAKFHRFLPDATVDHRWSGQVIETPDGLPYIGETAERQFVATGFAGNGMTFGTLGAMMITDAILSRDNPWTQLFDPHRKLVAGAWTYLKENKDYPCYLVRDRLARPDADGISDVKPGTGGIVQLGGEKVAAYRDEAGELTLCSPVCPHLQCIVAWNSAEKTWDCPCHGSRFTPDGAVISGPAEEPLRRLADTHVTPAPHQAAS